MKNNDFLKTAVDLRSMKDISHPCILHTQIENKMQNVLLRFQYYFNADNKHKKNKYYVYAHCNYGEQVSITFICSGKNKLFIDFANNQEIMFNPQFYVIFKAIEENSDMIREWLFLNAENQIALSNGGKNVSAHSKYCSI